MQSLEFPASDARNIYTGDERGGVSLCDVHGSRCGIVGYVYSKKVKDCIEHFRGLHVKKHIKT